MIVRTRLARGVIRSMLTLIAALVMGPFCMSILHFGYTGMLCPSLGDAPRPIHYNEQTLDNGSTAKQSQDDGTTAEQTQDDGTTAEQTQDDGTIAEQTQDNDSTAVVPTRRLELVHIPKTGGTAMEAQAARMNITWSMCHFKKGKILNETFCPGPILKHWRPSVKTHSRCPWWHLPPQYFELHDFNPYAGADLFCVVRNPYERLLSEYYYAGTYLAKKDAEQLNNVNRLNGWVRHNLLDLIVTMKRGDIRQNRTGNEIYFRNFGHFIPQYDYVFHHRRQIIKHVLRFENMEEEFHALMKLYDLPVRLPTHRLRPSHPSTLTAYNLTRSNLELVERLYEDDLREWGYEIISETLPLEVPPPAARNPKAKKQKELI